MGADLAKGRFVYDSTVSVLQKYGQQSSKCPSFQQRWLHASEAALLIQNMNNPLEYDFALYKQHKDHVNTAF